MIQEVSRDLYKRCTVIKASSLVNVESLTSRAEKMSLLEQLGDLIGIESEKR